MKYTIALVAMMMATPALADKMPIKPSQTCDAQVEALQNQILIMKKEIAALRMAESKPVTKPKPKPQFLQKKG